MKKSRYFSTLETIEFTSFINKGDRWKNTFIADSECRRASLLQIDKYIKNTDYKINIWKTQHKEINDDYYVVYPNNIISPIRLHPKAREFANSINEPGIVIAEYYTIQGSTSELRNSLISLLDYYRVNHSQLERSNNLWTSILEKLTDISEGTIAENIELEFLTYIPEDKLLSKKNRRIYLPKFNLGIVIGIPNDKCTHPLHDMTRDRDLRDEIYNISKVQHVAIRITDNKRSDKVYYIRVGDKHIPIKVEYDRFTDGLKCNMSYNFGDYHSIISDIDEKDFKDHGIYSNELEIEEAELTLKRDNKRLLKTIAELEDKVDSLDLKYKNLVEEKRALIERHKNDLELNQKRVDLEHNKLEHEKKILKDKLLVQIKQLEYDMEKISHEKQIIKNKLEEQVRQIEYEKEKMKKEKDILESKISHEKEILKNKMEEQVRQLKLERKKIKYENRKLNTQSEQLKSDMKRIKYDNHKLELQVKQLKHEENKLKFQSKQLERETIKANREFRLELYRYSIEKLKVYTEALKQKVDREKLLTQIIEDKNRLRLGMINLTKSEIELERSKLNSALSVGDLVNKAVKLFA